MDDCNPPAFPCSREELVKAVDGSLHGATAQYPGMTLRDWFAGQALIGLLANPGNSNTYPEDAEQAFRSADAMLAERAKEQA